MLYAAKQSNVKIILLENVGPSTTLAEFNTFNEAVNAGKLLIAPSGNRGLAGPANPASQFSALGGAALVVGSHNGGGGRSPFSNGALGVEGNYMTALGEGILAAGNQGDDFYYTVTGTSMAAPQVAAAAALIWSYAPSLTATEVAEILKKSATDLGAPGVDSIFGAGGLNIEAALAPIGIITAPIEEEEEEEEEEDGSGDSSDESGSSGGAGVALAALVLGGVGYALIRNNPDLDETLVLDEYGRTYELDLETRISVRNPGPSAESVLQELDTEQVNETLIQRSDFKLTASYRFDQRTSYLDPYIDDQEDDQAVKMQLTAFDQTGAQYAFGFNQRLPSFFNNMGASQNLPLTTGFFRSDAFSAPVMGFSNLGYHSSVGFRSETGWQSGLAFSSVDDEMRHGLKSESSSFHLGLKQKGFRVGLQLGFLEEDGNLLGGAAHGALSVSRAQTVFGAARGDIALNNHWSMVGQYTYGVTWADDYAASLVSDFSTIESNSWGFGLLGRDLLSKGDAFGVALSQPLRTIDGDARVSTPYWNQSVGGINFNTRRTSLVPDGTEHSIELFYRKSISRNVRFISYLVYRDQPLHEHKTESHASVVSAISWGFGMH
ncbi:MAG: S8 family serine peptidase, partial [Proteobacteria bacterium]|nr:S8 family serine peptidase [Pseudomonadota bacterium]